MGLSFETRWRGSMEGGHSLAWRLCCRRSRDRLASLASCSPGGNARRDGPLARPTKRVPGYKTHTVTSQQVLALPSRQAGVHSAICGRHGGAGQGGLVCGNSGLIWLDLHRLGGDVSPNGENRDF